MQKNILKGYEKEILNKQLKVIWTYHSNALEGNTLSQGDTSYIIESGLTISGKSLREHNEVVGHAKAIDLVYKLLDNDILEEENLFLLHKAIQTASLIDSERPNGAYKRVVNGTWHRINNKDKFFYYPHPDDINHLMKLWFTQFEQINRPIKSEEEAIKCYTNMHLSFTTIHPFWDGNGRLARLVSNLPLLKNGYLPIIIGTQNRQAYIEILSQYQISTKALDKDTNSNNLIDDTNQNYLKLLDFFKKESQNSEVLLKEVIESREQLKKK